MENEIRKQGRDIGFGIPIPAAPKQYDINDPFYGTLRITPANFVARVVSAKSSKTAVVMMERLFFHKKFKRYEKRRSKFSVHNPTSINAQEGDVVRVFATRPLSKTKHHVIVQVLGQYVDIKGQDLAAEELEAKKLADVAEEKESKSRKSKKSDKSSEE